MNEPVGKLNQKIIQCEACPRLIEWCRQVAREKKAAYRDQVYWGKPCPGFGDAHPRLLVVGLAPGAHGANRTGRMFAGDRSGEWLYRALFRAEFANQPESIDRHDGLALKDAYVTAVVRCAPPLNRPTTEERDRCIHFLEEEIRIFKQLKVIVCLGSFAWEGTFRALTSLGFERPKKVKFSHGAQTNIGPYTLLASYHPSQQNTFTGRLTEKMLDDVFQTARRLLDNTD